MLSKYRLAIGAALICCLGCGQEGGDGETQVADEIPLDVVVETEDDKVLYALGLGLYNMAYLNMNIATELSESDLENLFAGAADFALVKEPRINPKDFGAQIQQWLTQRQSAEDGTPPTVEAGPDDGNVLYSMGQIVAGRGFIAPLKGAWTTQQLGLMRKGFLDAGLKREPLVQLQDYGQKATDFLRSQMGVVAAQEKERGAAFLEEAAQEEGAVRTESGLVFRRLVAGSGATPTIEDVIKIHYHGTLTDGTVFDSTLERGQPAAIPLSRVIAGWQEGLALMKVGGKAKLTIPSDLAYGDGGSPPVIPPGAALVFEVELLEIVDTSAPANAATGE